MPRPQRWDTVVYLEKSIFFFDSLNAADWDWDQTQEKSQGNANTKINKHMYSSDTRYEGGGTRMVG
jgi:hypothetical protein